MERMLENHEREIARLTSKIDELLYSDRSRFLEKVKSVTKEAVDSKKAEIESAWKKRGRKFIEKEILYLAQNGKKEFSVYLSIVFDKRDCPIDTCEETFKHAVSLVEEDFPGFKISVSDNDKIGLRKIFISWE